MAENAQLLKGILEACVLKYISREPNYGYEILAALKQYGFGTIGIGTLYPILLRLEQKGAVTTRQSVSPSGPSRKYYTITDVGVEILDRFYSEWISLTKSVSLLFEEMNSDVQK